MTGDDGMDYGISAFVDCGASFNAISECLAKELKCKIITETESPLVITLGLDETRTIERKYTSFAIRLNHMSEVTITAFVFADIPESHDILLGMDFLSQTNPLIDWTRKTITGREVADDESEDTKGKRLLHYARHGFAEGSEQTLYTSLESYQKENTKGDFMFVITQKSERFENQGWDKIKENQPDVYDILIRHKGICFREEMSVDVVKEYRGQHGIRHEIDLTDNIPITSKQFRLSPGQREAVVKWSEEMLKAGVIRKSRSPYNSPIFCVKKPIGWRIVHDYRRLNAKTLIPQEPIPLKLDIIDAMSGSQWFSSMDLLWGYYQLLMREKDIPYTAFSTPDGHFEYISTPMGLSGAPATFNRFVQDAFSPLRDTCRAFFDDIFVFTKNESKTEHLKALDVVLDRCDELGIFVKLSKCVFAAHEIPILGDFMGREGIRMDPDKVSIIRDWPVPKNKRQMKSFLGTVVYNERFCKDYGRLVAPLHEVTRNKKKLEPITLNEHEMWSFEEVKRQMACPPILAIPDHDIPFIVRMDASDFAIGGALLQEHEDGERVVAYTGRKLSSEELSYDVRERELLAVLYATRIWKPYLLDKPFKVETDHQSLEALLTQKKCTRRLARWLDELSRFPITFKWIKGTTNILADGLSRRVDFEPEVPASVVSLRQFLEGLLADTESMLCMYAKGKTIHDQCKKNYPKDPFTMNLLRNMKSGGDNKFFERDGLLWYTNHGRERLVLPRNQDLLNQLSFLEHDTLTSGHPGSFKTLHALQEKYYWINMKKTVDRYVATCEKCQRNKTRQSKEPGSLKPLDIPESRWSQINMDFITKLPDSQGFDAIWVIVDRLTKRIHLIPCTESMTAQEAALIFKKNYQRFHGLPTEISSDRDKLFVSKFWQTLMELQRTTISLTTAYRKSGNGQSEICNRFIEDYIRNYMSPKDKDWRDYLEDAEFAFNSRLHSSIGMTPFEADIGYNPRSAADLMFAKLNSEGKTTESRDFIFEQQTRLRMAQDSIAEAQVRMQRYYNKNRPEQVFNVGDKVMLKTENLSTKHAGQGEKGKRKFGPKWIGPFDIVEKTNRDTYLLNLPSKLRLHPYFHTAMLKPYEKDKNQYRKNVPADEVITAEGHAGRIIEKLVSVRTIRDGTREFRVRFQGCSFHEDLWYPEWELKSVQGLIDELLASKTKSSRRKH